MFSTVVVSIYIPANSVGGFLFLYTLSSICWLYIFDGDYSDRYEVMLTVVLICISWSPKSLQMVTAAMKLKDACSFKESYDQLR